MYNALYRLPITLFMIVPRKDLSMDNVGMYKYVIIFITNANVPEQNLYHKFIFQVSNNKSKTFCSKETISSKTLFHIFKSPCLNKFHAHSIPFQTLLYISLKLTSLCDSLLTTLLKNIFYFFTFSRFFKKTKKLQSSSRYS